MGENELVGERTEGKGVGEWKGNERKRTSSERVAGRHNSRIAWNVLACDGNALGWGLAITPGRDGRMQAQSFLDEAVEMRQCLQGFSIVDIDRQQLGVELFGLVGMQR